MRPSEPFVRLSRELRHRREERAFSCDPESYSVERLWKRRGEWLAADSESSIGTLVNETLVPRLPERWWQDPDFWKGFAHFYPPEAHALVERADAAAAGRIVLFGWKQMEFGRSIPWSNRLSGSAPTLEWPRAHHSGLDFLHDPSDPERDVKWCWELNRFQHLLLLGAAWRLTGDERYPRAAREQIESWIAAVRYPQGIQWSSNLEVALRLLSWMRCHILCMDSIAWHEEFMRRFIPCLFLHCVHVANELTVHHAVSNHLLGEAAALATAGILCRFFKTADSWLHRGIRILEWLTPRLILPDGVYAEQSTGYFRFVAEFLLPLLHLAKWSGTALPEAISERVAAGIRFVDAVSADLREAPAIGDADSGHAIGWKLEKYWDFTSLAAVGTVLCGARINPDRIRAFPAEAYLMLGTPGRDAFQTFNTNALSNENYGPAHRHLMPNNKIPPSPPLSKGGIRVPPFRKGGTGGILDAADVACSNEHWYEPSTTLEHSKGTVSVLQFPHGGYQVCSDADFHVVLDAGPLGMPPRYGHGHADGLAITVSYKGVPVVVDAGTFVYNGPVQWREYFRSTAAHNTIRLDGLSQSEPLETFLWNRDLEIGAEPPRYREGWAMLHGFVRWRGAVHHRYVFHLSGQGVLVWDRVEGTGSRILEWFTHWCPACHLSAVTGSRFHVATDAGDLDLFLLGPKSATTEILKARNEPPAGWYSPAYGFKEPCSTLRLEVTGSLPATFLCAVKPTGSAIELPEVFDRLGLPRELVDRLRSAEFTSWAES